MSEGALSSHGERESADDEIDRLKADILFRRHRVVASMGELRRRVDGVMSWRHWVRTHGLMSVATALSLGFLIGGVGDARRRWRNHE